MTTIRRGAGPVLALLVVLGALAAGIPSGCRAAPERAVVILAAASLGGALADVAPAFEAAHPGTRVVVSLAGSQTLATQLLEGAPADLFASADARQMGRVVAAGRAAAPTAFAANTLVIITPRDDRAGIAAVEDLARPGVRVVLAGPEVPAGAYARTVLARRGLLAAVAANLVSEEASVAGVVGKVALGEADAGIAYLTDLRGPAGRALRAVPLPGAEAARATYLVAPLVDAAHPVEAAELARFLAGAEGRAILAAHGFDAP